VDTGDLALMRTAAADLPQVNLDDHSGSVSSSASGSRRPLTGPPAAGWRDVQWSAERPWRDWRWRRPRSNLCARTQT
jgi:hypothetical protein